LFSTLSRGLISLLLTLTRLAVVFIFVNFSFALFTPPLGDYHQSTTLGPKLMFKVVSRNFVVARHTF
jgi:hypothetical protein